MRDVLPEPGGPDTQRMGRLRDRSKRRKGLLRGRIPTALGRVILARDGASFFTFYSRIDIGDALFFPENEG